jgi:hypothetical protein
MPEQPQATVVGVDLEGPRISLADLKEVASNLLGALSALEREIAQTPSSGMDWLVSKIDTSSLRLSARPEVLRREVPPWLPDRVADEFVRGMDELETAGTRPSTFNDVVLEHARRLAAIAARNGVARVVVRSNRQHAGIGPLLAAHVEEILRPKERSLGTVEGRMEAVSIHGQSYFNIYDRLTGKAVKCFFPEDMLERVRAGLGHRVAVSGIIWSSAEGVRDNIKVRGLDVFPDPVHLPTAGEVRGILNG